MSPGRRALPSILACWAIACLAALPAAAASHQTAPQIVETHAAEPALWVIRDADSTVYLFGTVHMLRPGTVWQTPRVLAAFDASTDIWFEVDAAAEENLSSLAVTHGVSRDRPLLSRLSPDDRRALAAAAGLAGGTPEQFDTLRPWLAAMAVGNAPMIAAGYGVDSGVETVLRERAAAGGKTLRGLETMEDQFRYLAALPEAIEMDLLHYMLQPPERLVAELDASVAAWLVGDMEGIDRAVAGPMRRRSEALYDVMLARRSLLLADHLQAVLEGSGVAFVALGAGYLAGDDSVQTVLADRGVTVTRE